MEHHDDFLYFPQAAFLFTPFNVLPFMVGEFAWRIVTFGLFAYALARLYQFFLSGTSQSPGKTFFLLALLAIPSSFASFRNAQFDLPLAALIVLASAEIAAKRWSAAAAWLCLALALKPLAVVPMLLFGALYWKLIPRISVGVLIVPGVAVSALEPGFCRARICALRPGAGVGLGRRGAEVQRSRGVVVEIWLRCAEFGEDTCPAALRGDLSRPWRDWRCNEWNDFCRHG